ncbi:MAG: alpha/beta hydrolase [Crocinitomicaceae bacterium]|nr:alpha/beta hydrolase [Crocinitomicaceae bacterium]|tara:strand:+ start:9055 stop:9843 length:789 start_codon:yes stop_codon:yes gene_type:complete
MAFAEYKRAKIYYSETGKGRTVILLHGFLESSNMWKTYISTLRKKYRVVSIDLPGHGNSECFGYVHTMDEMAEAVKAVLSQLKIRKASLVGHSMGGYVALAFGDLFPDNVKSICLFFSTSWADSPQKKQGRNQAIEVVKKNHKSFIRVAFPMLFRSKFRKIFGDEIKAAKEDAFRTSKQGIIAALEGMKRRRSREMLLKFAPYPIHFISGQRDPIIPVESIRAQLKIKGTVSGAILKEPGHMGHIEAPSNCLGEIFDFLNRN